MQDSDAATLCAHLKRHHLLEGFALICVFSILGIFLEVFLAFKVTAYVNADQEARRLMWRLAHAHGTLLGLMNVALGVAFASLPDHWFPRPARLISRLMTASSLLIPAGFFFAGVSAHSGDPGIAVTLVPAGAIAFLTCTGLSAAGLWQSSHSVAHSKPNGDKSDRPS